MKRAWDRENPERKKFLNKRWYEANWRTALITDAKRRALQRGLAFDLPDDWKEGVTHCEWSGLAFVLRDPMYAASIDRKDNSLGYTVDNSRLILRGLNTFKSWHTQDTVDVVIQAIKTRSKP